MEQQLMPRKATWPRGQAVSDSSVISSSARGEMSSTHNSNLFEECNTTVLSGARYINSARVRSGSLVRLILRSGCVDPFHFHQGRGLEGIGHAYHD